MQVPRIGSSASRVIAVMALALALAACNSAGGLFGGGGGGGPQKIEYQPSDFLKTGYCPPIIIRNGTENLAIYERGHDNEPAYVRYQASIGRTARECHTAGNTLTVKVGIAGRVVAGPKGGAGSLTVPLRVVIVKQMGGAKPLYSQLFKVPLTLTAPEFGTDFSQVFDQVTAAVGPDDRDLIIYVGFDSGPKT